MVRLSRWYRATFSKVCSRQIVRGWGKVRKKKTVTMQTIADQIGVSKVTVSKALNNKEGVNSQLRKEIQDLAQALGYIGYKNEIPQNQNKYIVILVQEKFVETTDYVSFYLRFYQKLSKAFNMKGYICNLFTIPYTIQENDIFSKLFPKDQLSGVIALGPIRKTYLKVVQSLNVPFILLDHYDANLEVDCIASDNYYTSYELTSYLIKMGHKHIGFVGNIDATSSIQDRYMGYRRALLELKIDCNKEWIIKDRNESQEEIHFVLPNQMPTAFVCNCDDTAYKFVHYLKQEGYKIPQDISIGSFDDDIYAELCEPSLTTVRVDMDVMVNKTVDMFIRRTEENKGEKPKKIFVKGDIVYRDSVERLLDE